MFMRSVILSCALAFVAVATAMPAHAECEYSGNLPRPSQEGRIDLPRGDVGPGPFGLPSLAAGKAGPFTIGQSVADVRAIILDKLDVIKRREHCESFSYKTLRTKDYVLEINLTAKSSDGAGTDLYRLLFTSPMTGQRLFMIHRQTEYGQLSQPDPNEAFQSLLRAYSPQTSAGEASLVQLFSSRRLVPEAAARADRSLRSCLNDPNLLDKEAAETNFFFPERILNGGAHPECGARVEAGVKRAVTFLSVWARIQDHDRILRDREMVLKYLQDAAAKLSTHPKSEATDSQ